MNAKRGIVLNEVIFSFSCPFRDEMWVENVSPVARQRPVRDVYRWKNHCVPKGTWAVRAFIFLPTSCPNGTKKRISTLKSPFKPNRLRTNGSCINLDILLNRCIPQILEGEIFLYVSRWE